MDSAAATTTSGRVYPVAVDKSGYLSVNVPWTDTDTNTHNSHAIISGTKSNGSTQIKGSASSGDITLGDSGVTAGAYGDTAAQTPGYNATFKVPSISVNAKGIVTAIGEHTVKIPASDNTDTKNTAGATNNLSKLFLIGADSQAANPQTYSQTNVYMTDGTLTASSLSTNTLMSQRLSNLLNLKVSDSSDTLHNVARFSYYSVGGAQLEIDGHLALYEEGSCPNKPINRTGVSVNFADYFNTGITTCGVDSSNSPVSYKLSFPGKSGTISTVRYKHNIALSGLFSGGPGGSAYCTFSFISDSPALISSLSSLASALAVNFNNKICPACGLFGYYSSENVPTAALYLITGVCYNSNAVQIFYVPIASTLSSSMKINADPSTSASS